MPGTAPSRIIVDPPQAPAGCRARRYDGGVNRASNPDWVALDVRVRTRQPAAATCEAAGSSEDQGVRSANAMVAELSYWLCRPYPFVARAQL